MLTTSENDVTGRNLEQSRCGAVITKGHRKQRKCKQMKKGMVWGSGKIETHAALWCAGNEKQSIGGLNERGEGCFQILNIVT